MQRHIFRSYDIRGIYPTDFDTKTAYDIGRALARKERWGRVVVGRDMRLGAKDIHDGLVRGLIDEGVSVEDVGLTPIDGIYFAVGKQKYDGGVMVTASHNPKEYIGLKMIHGNMTAVRGADVLKFLENNLQPEEKKEGGSVIEKDILEDHVSHILSFVDGKKLKPFNIVVDAGNGMAGKMIPALSKHLPFMVTPLFFDLDGNFPNHPSDPLKPESQTALVKKVRETNADLGVIFDGDTDRMFFVDETGTFIRADYTLLLLAKMMLETHPGEAIVYTVECSKIVPEKIKEMGGRAIRTPVGYANVWDAMRREGAILGGEMSAHYAFKENFCTDSGFIALLFVLANCDKKKEGDMQKLKERYKDGNLDEMDGLSIEYPDWWCVIRASNTEPLLRINIEGKTKEAVEEKKEELLSFI